VSLELLVDVGVMHSNQIKLLLLQVENDVALCQMVVQSLPQLSYLLLFLLPAILRQVSSFQQPLSLLLHIELKANFSLE